MPEETAVKVDTPFVQDAILSVLQQYYTLAKGGPLNKQHLIQDDSLKTIIGNFVTTEMTPQVALFICKILIVLTDSRRHAAQMAERGYVPIIGRLSESPMPPRLVAKYIQVQSRLMQAEQQQQGAAADKAEDRNEKAAAQRQRRSKELTFVLPMCNEFQQSAISQQVLKVRGCLSVSFRTSTNKHETLAIVRCRADVEPKQLADSIMAVGFEDVGYVLRTDEGNSELFTFYRDENAELPPADLPQYLDDNIEVFDPTTALTTPDFAAQNGGANGGGWLNSAKSLFSFW